VHRHDKVADLVQEKFMATINNLSPMPIAAAARLLHPNCALARACTRAAAPPPGALLQ
jgi:hypothetical protein